jgi:hypothetical protein
MEVKENGEIISSSSSLNTDRRKNTILLTSKL